MASTFIIWACLASRSSSYIFIFDSQVSFCIYGISYFAMATVLLCSTSTGLLAFFRFLCLDFSGSVGKVECGYSDAGFRDRRAILFFGYPFHSKIPLAVQRHNGFSITASTLRGHTGFLASSLCFFWIYSRSVPETLCLRTDTVLCLRTSLTCLFTNPYRYSFWSCYSSFFRCKVSMQPGTAESLGQWCSFTNLPLSGGGFDGLR